ncbi:MAG: aldehyde ferredoxin oxidoreductase N-terminal domain-containing protein, partial [Pseudomonadota bacterium]
MTVKKKKGRSPGFKGGYLGKVLRVDLTRGKISEEGLPPVDVLKKFIGCWGLGLQYLYDMVP